MELLMDLKSKGFRQGCPISPLLFLLVAQIMAIHIKKDIFRGIKIEEKEIKCTQLADDTTLFLRDYTEVEKAIKCLQLFSYVSGLSLNINKCELMALGSCNFPAICNIPVKEVVKYLGIKISKNKEVRNELNFTPIIQSFEKKLNSWLMRDISLTGRVLLVKAQGLSRLVYTAQVLDINPSLIKMIDTKLFKFIWKNKSHYIKKENICRSKIDGGLNVLDFKTSNTIFKIKWLQK